MPGWLLRYGIEVQLHREPVKVEISSLAHRIFVPLESVPELIEALQQVQRFGALKPLPREEEADGALPK